MKSLIRLLLKEQSDQGLHCFVGGGRVVRRYWVNFQCRGAQLIWIVVGHGPATLVVGAVGVVWTFFLWSVIFLFFLSRPDID